MRRTVSLSLVLFCLAATIALAHYPTTTKVDAARAHSRTFL